MFVSVIPTHNRATMLAEARCGQIGETRVANRIWIDVEDLFMHASAGMRPSGIQRLAIELCRALVALPQHRGYLFFVRHDTRRKSLVAVPWTEVEAVFHAMSNGSGILNSPASLLKRMWRKIFRCLPMPLKILAAALARRYRQLSQHAMTDHFADAKPGDVVVSFGAPWVTRDYFSYIERAVHEKQLRFAVLIHDIIPVRRPEWCEFRTATVHRAWLDRGLLLADTIFTNSAATADDVARYASDRGLGLHAVPIPIPIGTGFQKSANKPRSATSASSRLPPADTYALIVSTIEPRKNHALLFAVWRRLLEDMTAAEVPTLVFAGRAGWLASDLMQQLRNSDFLDGKIVHIDNPTDEEIEALYDGCRFTLFPSFYEGWGLPVTESHAFGRPCIASKTTSLPEAGGALARYIDPENITDAYRVIRETIEDRVGLRAWRDRVRREFKRVEWSESARAVLQALGLPRSEVLPTERWLDETTCSVDITATPDQLAGMLSRIKAAWESFGETDAHYSVLTEEIYRSRSFPESREKFYASGVAEVRRALAFLLRNRIELSAVRHVVDYGCGVGRLTIPFAKQFPFVTGVDVSGRHLDHAKRNAEDQGVKNVDFVKLTELGQLHAVKGVDFIFSRIVLQHNPPPVIAFTLRALLGGLNAGGCALFQVPTFIRGFSFSAAEYLSKPSAQMEMNAIPQCYIYEICRASGCDVLEVREDSATGSASMISHTFLVQKRVCQQRKTVVPLTGT
jgi:glycosyltransferase involved in cell wall biosynthesis/SAM-dependent methyltransferase